MENAYGEKAYGIQKNQRTELTLTMIRSEMWAANRWNWSCTAAYSPTTNMKYLIQKQQKMSTQQGTKTQSVQSDTTQKLINSELTRMGLHD